MRNEIKLLQLLGILGILHEKILLKKQKKLSFFFHSVLGQDNGIEYKEP